MEVNYVTSEPEAAWHDNDATLVDGQAARPVGFEIETDTDAFRNKETARAVFFPDR